MNKQTDKKKNRMNIHQLIINEGVRCSRMLRNCRDGKITLSAPQVLSNESLLRLAMEYSEYNPFRTPEKN